MRLHPGSFKTANEILYILYSSEEYEGDSISQLGVQKLLYLSNILAPVKEIVLEAIRFVSFWRGPWSISIQQVLDQLVALDLIKIVSFKQTYANNSIAFYKINEGGIQIVENLTRLKKEHEKLWWIGLITKISHIYVGNEALQNIDDFTGVDKIIKLVYQDPAFLKVRGNRRYGDIIDIDNPENPTAKLIEFAKTYIKNNPSILANQDEKKTAEYIVLTFFEFLYSKYLDEVTP